jgi:hypothetical protein
MARVSRNASIPYLPNSRPTPEYLNHRRCATHRRRWNDIVSSEEPVGMTQAGGLHVDQDFASHRRGNVHVLEIEPTAECVKYKRLHL